jgi:DNA polymerase III subunit gamma/tau
VYIIDEVHMLSEKAFNAFLKTLEEPPPHAKFVFATTEIRKVPVTILSRCQRFDLRRVDVVPLATHLAKICGLEEVTFEEEALTAIARAAEGSVRDSLSLLDQAIAHGAGHVDSVSVRSMIGLADRGRIFDLFETLMRGDVATALTGLRDLYAAGADPIVILQDLAECVHTVTRLKYVPELAQDTTLNAVERDRAAQAAQTLSVRTLSVLWQMLLKGIQEVQNAPRPMPASEMLLVRLAHAADLPPPDAVLRRVLEGGGAAPAPSGSGGGSGTPSLKMVANGSYSVTQAMPQAETARALVTLETLIAWTQKTRDIGLQTALERDLRIAHLEFGRLEFFPLPRAKSSLASDLGKFLQAQTNTRWMVSVTSTDPQTPTLHEIREKAELEKTERVRQHPVVAAVFAAFPDATITGIETVEKVDVLKETALPIETEMSDDGDD